jgi:triosephosphate isomerase
MMLIAANWKMNLLPEDVPAWLDAVLPALPPPPVEVLVLPSFPLLPLVRSHQAGTRLLLGAQNAGPRAAGAFTGEVSPRLLRALGCSHALLGHSERRRLFCEGEDLIRQRLEAVRSEGLVPVLCVGEGPGEDRRRVLAEELSGVGGGPLVVAYEPLAAIGSGQPASPADARAAGEEIREILGESVPVLYGGSVAPDNAASFLRAGGVDGLLVGTASLDGRTFRALIEVAAEVAAE